MSKRFPPIYTPQNGNNNGNGQHGLKLRRQVEGITNNHRTYIEAITNSDIIFCEGVAGTGKTYIAVGMAMHMILSETSQYHKLIISRPIIPACGEDIGFLPGDLKAKTDPYMVPIYEAVRKFCRDEAEYKRVIDQNCTDPLIEVVPLAFMRGRTFDNAFIILDEAQNTNREQMKMFLSRMGRHCKTIITGDLSQSDIDNPTNSGLLDAINKLEDRNFESGIIEICYMDSHDIMRHGLVSEILHALHENPRNSYFLSPP